MFGADGDLNKREDIFYDIIEIIRNEEVGVLHFALDTDNGTVIISNEKDSREIVIDTGNFSDEANFLLKKIQESGAAAFTVEHTSEFMDGILCKKLKAPSAEKSDISIKVHDYVSGIETLQGFSIKSRLGKPSTLLNAGKTTSLIYEISGKFGDEDMDSINEMLTFKSDGKPSIALTQRMKFLTSDGNVKLNYVGMDNSTFRNNLTLIDSELPSIVALLVLEQYESGTKNIVELVTNIARKNPLGYDTSGGHQFYEYKVKKLLCESALGMKPDTVWTGHADATGGYIIVREDGEVLCYHLFNRNDFEEYLLKNTRLEQASTSRYEFGDVFKKDGKYYIKLNLQIRFIK